MATKIKKIPNKILAESIADIEWAKDFVKEPSLKNLFYYFALSDSNGDFIDTLDCKNWTKRLISLFENDGIDPKDFLKNYNYKKIKEVYDEFAFGTGNTDSETYSEQIELTTPFVELCDFLQIEIKKYATPTNSGWSGAINFEEDLKEAICNSSKQGCKNFARFFSKKPQDWFEEEKDWKSQFD
jgi:hypothetical protein